MLLRNLFMPRLAATAVVIWATAGIAAQVLEIPQTWTLQDTTSNRSRESRETLAVNAAMALNVGQIDPSQFPPPLWIPDVQYISNLFAGLAMQDHYTGNDTWFNPVTKVMQSFNRNFGLYGVPGSTGFTGDANHWALAFYYAYRTYNQSFLLETAIQIYNQTNATCFVTPSAAAGGTGVGRNVSFTRPSNCTSGTYAGAVFSSNGSPDHTDVCAECVGPFLTLSAYLYEETNNSAYLEAAQLSADFMIQYMWNGTIVYDTFDLSSCSWYPNPLTLNQAGFIEGLAVLANVTKNNTLTALLYDVVSNVTTFPVWSLDGSPVIQESNPDLAHHWQSNLKGTLIRALAEARMRNPGTDLAHYIEAYITIQFNALLSQAQGLTPNATNWYSSSWTGSHATAFSSAGSIAAVDVLNAAIDFVSPTGSDKTRLLHAGAVAGGVVSGVAAIAVAIVFLLWRRRRKNAPCNDLPMAISATTRPGVRDTTGAVEPFVLSSSAGQPSKWENFYAPSGSGRARAMPPVTRGHIQSTVAPAGESEGLTELPSLVERLYNMLHGQQLREPPPPAYGH